MRQLERLDPNLALAAAAGSVVALEAAYRTWTSDAWLLLEALAAALALLYAWREQDRLRLVPVLAVVAALSLGLVGVHWLLDVVGDKDTSVVFRWQGNGLRRGGLSTLRVSVGAVLLFGLEAWVGGGVTRWANALLMVPFAVLVAACVWLTRLPYAPWLAALVGLVAGERLLLAVQVRPRARSATRARTAPRAPQTVGTCGRRARRRRARQVDPALAAVALLAWLVSTRRVRAAAEHAGSRSPGTVAARVRALPGLEPLGGACRVRAPERSSITPESVWYLLLRPFDLAHVRTHISFSAGAPGWADVAAGLLQVAVVLALVVAGGARAGRHVRRSRWQRSRPAAFLLTNRISARSSCSSRFAAWAFAASLVVGSRREQLSVGAAMATVAVANEFGYPFALPRYDVTWVVCSLVLFALGLGLTAWLALRATRTTA